LQKNARGFDARDTENHQKQTPWEPEARNPKSSLTT